MGLTTKERNLLNRTCPNLKKAKLGDSLPFGATVQLNGTNPTKIVFGKDVPAIITGTGEEPFDLSNIVGDATIVFTAGSGDATTITIELPDGEEEGDVKDPEAVTAQEIADIINENSEDVIAMVDDGKLVLATVTAGKDASLTIGEGTTHTVLGLTGSAVGAQGLDWVDMPDTNYIVVATLRDVAATNLAGTGLSIRNRQKTSFEIECEDTDSEAKVDLIILR